MASTYSIRVHKDYLKFSAAHFLIFPDGTAERLHGHNYKVWVELESPLDDHGLVIDFKVIKPVIKAVVDELDERLLLPGLHAELRVAEEDGRVRVDYRDRRYDLPADDCLVLPINNTSAENLATWISDRISDELAAVAPLEHVQRLLVGVEEAPGQIGCCERRG
ncbi:MAG: 6-pyruvoyl tetrahydropterin synthase family protein [Planctomycetota bacterium]